MTAIYHPRPERWPQVSLRGLLLLLTLFCVWLGVQVKWIRDRHDLNELRAPGFYRSVDSCPAPWSLRILGEKGVSIIVLSPDAQAPEARKLKQLFPEARLILAYE